MILRDVEVDGHAGLDVRLEAGRIAGIGRGLRGPDEFDGRGGALIPGLADHHIHLFGLAAQAASVDVAGAGSAVRLQALIAEAAAARPPGAWIRAMGYHESIAGDLGRADLDRLAPAHPFRLQHQTRSLWMLNSAALEALGDDLPDLVERGADGRPTGRIWRGDAWLRARIGAEPPPLASIGRRLAAFGITALTDASVTTDAGSADRLAEAVRSGELPQRLALMSGGPLTPPLDGAFTVGPSKVLLDDHDLPAVEDFVSWIGRARAWGRAVAVHCVTAAELAVTLAAFEDAGARPGDRIEHGGMIPEAAVPQLQAMGLTVVTQPAFIRDRGDRYAAEVPEGEQADLYRCASLKAAGVPVAGSSDAPYATSDPWLGMTAAIDRRSRGGREIGPLERVPPAEALGLYLGSQTEPGGSLRRVAVGEPADLCLLKLPLREALAAPGAELVRATLLAGRPTYLAG